MKLILFVMLLFSVNTFASVECRSLGQEGYQVFAVDTSETTAILSVRHQDKTLYQMKAIVKADRGGKTYTSPLFTNRNKAPSNLFFSLYVIDHQLVGFFNETSYLPVIPALKMSCRKI